MSYHPPTRPTLISQESVVVRVDNKGYYQILAKPAWCHVEVITPRTAKGHRTDILTALNGMWNRELKREGAERRRLLRVPGK